MLAGSVHQHALTPAGMNSSTSSWNTETQQSLLTPTSSIVPATNVQSNPADVRQDLPSVTNDLNWINSEQPALQANDNFAAWLFQSPGSQNDELNLANMPFLDFGLEYSPKDIWSFEDLLSDPTATNEAPYTEGDAEQGQAKRAFASRKSISQERATEISQTLLRWLQKERRTVQDPTSLLFCLDSRFPNLNLDVLDNLVANYCKMKSSSGRLGS